MIPIVLEITLGLIFVYLTLSLIASELQEILGTLFQWRAEHLKYSIEELLAGKSIVDLEPARQLANRLYSSPLIRDLNYEARGPLARSARRMLQALGRVYRLITRKRNVFGAETSGPSYIPAETFAASLLENLQFEQLQQILAQSRLRQFGRDRISIPVSETVSDLRASLSEETLLSAELQHLEAALGQIFADYQARRIDLSRTLERMLDQLDEFAELSAQVLPTSSALSETFLRRLRYLRLGLAGKLDAIEVWARKIQPTLPELLLLLDQDSAIYQEANRVALQDGGSARRLLNQLQAYALPAPLRESLVTLAERAQSKTTSIEAGLGQFQIEIEAWFDRAMDRAGGVYKRNAKAVGLLIGFAIAVLINADTFYMVSRLGVDQAVRSSIIQTVDQLDAQALSDRLNVVRTETDPAPSLDTLTSDLKSLGNAVQQTLSDYPLPLGRTAAITRAQTDAEATWPLPVPRRWLGWLVTGIAISMGSSFWFDALRRVVSVRTTGSKPDATPDKAE